MIDFSFKNIFHFSFFIYFKFLIKNFKYDFFSI